MKNFIKPIFAILLFLFLQVVGTFAVVVCKMAMDSGFSFSRMNDIVSDSGLKSFLSSDVLSLSLVISGLLTIICFYLFNLINRRKAFCVHDVNMKWMPIVVLGAFAGIFATNLMTEWFDLPNLLEGQFLDMSKSLTGVFAIAVLGPVTEELTFREAFIGNLLKGGIKPWMAIFFSSLFFGLIHGNPAQIPFAFIIGLILGFVYYRTGNIVLSSIIHILNNSLAVIEMNIFGEHADEITFRSMLGSFDIPVIIILVIFCILTLRRFNINYISH